MTGSAPSLRALLSAALLLFANARGLFGHLHCPRHDAASGTAAVALLEPASASDGEHAHHAATPSAHDPATATHDGAPQGGPCTCVDDCAGCRTVEGPLAAAGGLRAAPSLESVAPRTPDFAFAAWRAPHQLPFATAPPAIA